MVGTRLAAILLLQCVGACTLAASPLAAELAAPAKAGESAVQAAGADASRAIDAGRASRDAHLAQASGCVVDPATLCLHGQRFAVRASFDTGSGPGIAQAVALTDDAGYFWFFASSNVEVVVKTLDGCGFNDHFWFFAGGLTNVHVSLTVTDTLRHVSQVYQNPAQTVFEPIQDIKAFDTCP